jgi:hypothetical protein
MRLSQRLLDVFHGLGNSSIFGKDTVGEAVEVCMIGDKRFDVYAFR